MKATGVFFMLVCVFCDFAVFTRSQNFLVNYIGSFKSRVMPSTNKNDLTSSFLIFICLLCLSFAIAKILILY